MLAQRLDRAEFFKTYNLPENALEISGLRWEELELIHEDHSCNMAKLQFTGNYIRDVLQQVEEVHSLKVRIKHPEHLIEKIIRKKMDDISRDITLDNYRWGITDLIGVRALHLFKEEWGNIHDFIVDIWELSETPPTAYVRKGDPEEFIKLFEDRGCQVQNHKYGYRSVHYLVKSQPSKDLHVAEVQVRTIFEEGWSEIDHRVRYPYFKDNATLLKHSRLLNGFAGSADEMGTFINSLKKELENST